jgi:hypothetical protein
MLFLSFVPSILLAPLGVRFENDKKGDGSGVDVISATDALPHERQTAACGLDCGLGHIRNDWVRHDTDRRR